MLDIVVAIAIMIVMIRELTMVGMMTRKVATGHRARAMVANGQEGDDDEDHGHRHRRCCRRLVRAVWPLRPVQRRLVPGGLQFVDVFFCFAS